MSTAALQLHVALSLRLDATEAYRLAHAYRSEVLTEAAAELDRIADTVEASVAEHYGPASGIGPGSAQMLRDAAGNVRYMAGKDTRDGTQPPAGESTQPAPDFFQPGRTYVDGDGYRAPETLTLFRVEHVATHPGRGILRAFGWAKVGAAPGGTWHGYFQDASEFAGWTEYPEGEVPAEEIPRVLCAHGYVLGQDSCPGCDAAEEQPHRPNPVHVRTSDGRELELCRTCGQPPMRCPRPAEGEVPR